MAHRPFQHRAPVALRASVVAICAMLAGVGAAAQAEPLTLAQGGAQPGAGGVCTLDEARRRWPEVRDTKDPEIYEEFARRCAGTPQAALAKSRARSLAARTPAAGAAPVSEPAATPAPTPRLAAGVISVESFGQLLIIDRERDFVVTNRFVRDNPSYRVDFIFEKDRPDFFVQYYTTKGAFIRAFSIETGRARRAEERRVDARFEDATRAITAETRSFGVWNTQFDDNDLYIRFASLTIKAIWDTYGWVDITKNGRTEPIFAPARDDEWITRF